MIDQQFQKKIDTFLEECLSDDPILKSYQQLEIIRRVSLTSSNLYLEAASSHYSTFVLPAHEGKDIATAMKEYFLVCNKHGYTIPKEGSLVLNPYELKPGDVILVSPKDIDNTPFDEKLAEIPERVINYHKFKQTFKTQYILTGSKDHAIYTHASIVRKGHRIFEALPIGGTVEADSWHYMDNSKYHFKVLRLIGHEELGQEIIREIAKFFGANYDFLDLLMLKAKTEGWEWLSNMLGWTTEDRKFICSGIYAAACNYLHIDLGLDEYMLSIDDEPSLITPAHLSLSPAFEEVYSSAQSDNKIELVLV